MPDIDGTIYAIQLRDISPDYTNIEDFPHKIADGEYNKYLLRKGDILFIAKGQNNFAVLFDKEYPSVATSIFFVIRPDIKKVHPEYLTWYINQSVAQEYLHKGKEGTLITNINKQTLGELPIKLPTIEKQKYISKIALLELIEINLMKQLTNRRKLLVEQILLASI